jgi:redox-sensitive bicupin YhaK (pirin superfamily)
MIKIRKANDRGLANHEWLKSRHTFSFADYYDPNYMGFGVLRVINEDRIEGGTGFGAHSHKNMEIVSYVIEGELHHKDSTGTESIIKPGDIQRMSAGSGVVHSEYNNLPNQITHFLQIWIFPDTDDIQPGYEQKSFNQEFSSGDLILVASQSGKDGSISIHQDVEIYACKSRKHGELNRAISDDRLYWIQVIKGFVTANNVVLEPGDGAGISHLSELTLHWDDGSEFLLFDLTT